MKNSFEINGFVASTAEVRTFTNSSLAKFPIAVSREEKIGDSTSRVSALIGCEMWRKNAESDSFNLCELMIVFPVQIYYNYGYKEPFFVTFYICRRKCHD